MYGAPVGSDLGSDVDIKIVFPDDDIIRIESARLFAEPDGSLCRRFLGHVFLALEIDCALIGLATAPGGTRRSGCILVLRSTADDKSLSMCRRCWFRVLRLSGKGRGLSSSSPGLRERPGGLPISRS
jgi:hypothetical protein